MTSSHGPRRRVASGAPVNVFGYDPGLVPWNTPTEDVPTGYRRASDLDEIRRLQRSFRVGLAGYESRSANDAAVLYMLGRMYPTLELLLDRLDELQIHVVALSRYSAQAIGPYIRVQFWSSDRHAALCLALRDVLYAHA